MAAGLPRRLYRSRDDKMLGGVSAGLAAYFAIDPVLVRLLWVVGAVFTGGLLALAYILLWIIVPQEDYAGLPSDVVRENVNEMAAEARRVADDVREALRGEPTGATPAAGGTELTPAAGGADVTPAAGGTTAGEAGAETGSPAPKPGGELLSPVEAEEAKRRRTITAGAILLALGLLFLATNLGIFRWFNWGLYWPLLLVALGALLIWNRTRSGT